MRAIHINYEKKTKESNMLKLNWYPFSKLTTRQLYDILALRSDVFVVEQKCSYLDPDGKDIDALHLLGMQEDLLVAYIRLFPPTLQQNFILFGRVVTAKSVRGKKYGKSLIRELLAYCEKHFPAISIKCSAQYHLKKFYEEFGFRTEGEVYEEASIPHIDMRKDFK